MIHTLLSDAAAKRIPLNAERAAYRLFNSAGDGCDGLIVDRYGEYLLVQVFKESLLPSIDDIFSALAASSFGFGFEVKGILAKKRIKSDLKNPQAEYISECVRGETPPEEYIVMQNGIRICVNLISGMNTGLFLDMRAIRDNLGSVYDSVKPQSMLNLFCYTGAFSVHAMAHGVTRCINVDTSRSVLKRASRNFTENGYTPDGRDFCAMDAEEYLCFAAKKKMHFDFVIFDPPTFSRGKGGGFSV
ncbi:MAG: class I SAM-dependent methyltransferase, partial [Spirochaetota bacterium]